MRARRTRERAWVADGCRCVVGVDEAGRGPLAGPVVAAAVALPWPARLSGLEPGDRLADSKDLRPDQRERLFRALGRSRAHIGWASVGSAGIDSMNILEASREAMRLAVHDLGRRGPTPDAALVDGLPVPKFPCAHEAVVGGDRRELVIAAASIVAKVVRDRMMRLYDRLHPGYEFASHKGYMAPAHLAALDRLGPCPIHRRSFAPVRDRSRVSPEGVADGPSDDRRPGTRGGGAGGVVPDPLGL